MSACPRCGNPDIVETTQQGFGFPNEHFAYCGRCKLTKDEIQGDIGVYCHPVHRDAAFEILRDTERCVCGKTRVQHQKYWIACKEFRSARCYT